MDAVEPVVGLRDAVGWVCVLLYTLLLRDLGSMSLGRGTSGVVGASSCPGVQREPSDRASSAGVAADVALSLS